MPAVTSTVSGWPGVVGAVLDVPQHPADRVLQFDRELRVRLLKRTADEVFDSSARLGINRPKRDFNLTTEGVEGSAAIERFRW